MSAAATSPLPHEPDVRLSIIIYGTRFDFAACLTAALVFVQEHQRRRYVEAVSVAPSGADQLPRLPNERLYLQL
ncbi:hypothetical protein [Nocardia asteroides]|uniref:hypothetical protein n=1 Tax=Nocardia asteroides TaxID=1824 RepID=UPI001E3FB44E|nr:hypothetical protein [Nocardia asteroides]UGT61439.1 hypothetical protein LTT61_30680 [Nocardia asteroides]